MGKNGVTIKKSGSGLHPTIGTGYKQVTGFPVTDQVKR